MGKKVAIRIFMTLVVCLLVPVILYAGKPAAKGANDITADDVRKIVSEQMGRSGKILHIDKRGVNIDDATFFFTKDTRCYSASGKPLSVKDFKHGNVVRYLLDSPSTMGIMVKLR